MAISVGDACLKLGVDTKDLDKGMQGLGARIKKQQKAIGIGMVAMGGAILAAGLMSVKSFAKMGDEVQKMALRTGFSTEALSELRHAAEISGASLDSLEKAVKRMSKTIVDASEGMSTYLRAFDRIGIAVDDLMGLKPEEQFDKIAMAIADIEDPTIRAATAQDIFGRAGTQLLPLLAQGAEGMAELREEAHKLGIVFDQEAANAAAEFNDALTRLGESITGIKNQVGAALVPTLTSLTDSITEVTKGFIEWSKANQELSSTLVQLGMGLGGVVLGGGALVLMMPGLTSALAAARAVAASLHITLGALIGRLALLAIGIGMVTYGIMELNKNQQYQQKHIEDLRKIEQEYIKMLAGKENQYHKLLLAYAEDIKMREAMGRAAESEIEWLRQNKEALEDIKRYEREYAQWVKDMAAWEAQAGENKEATEGLTGANIALGNSYAYVAGMALKAWEALSHTQRVGGVESYYKSMYPEAQWLDYEKIFGKDVVGQISKWAPGLVSAASALREEQFQKWWQATRPDKYTIADIEAAREKYGAVWTDGQVGPGMQYGGIAMRPMVAQIAESRPEAVIPLDRLERMLGGKAVNIIHIYLDGEEIGGNVIQRVTEEVRQQGGL